MYKHHSDVPWTYYLNTDSMPTKIPLTIPTKEDVTLKDCLSCLDQLSQSSNHKDSWPDATPRKSLMDQFHQIEKEVMIRQLSQMGCLSHGGDMTHVGLDWESCNDLLEEAVGIASQVANGCAQIRTDAK